MSFLVKWGRQPQVEVADVASLDQVLDQIAESDCQGGRSYAVSISRPDGDGEYLGLQIGIGHPERSFVFWIGTPADEYGVEDGLVPLDRDVTVDFGRHTEDYPPDWTMVTPPVARLAAHEFVTTGQRPTCLSWSSPA